MREEQAARVEAQPLTSGSHPIYLRTGSTPLPERGITGEALARWYRDGVSRYRRLAARRDSPPQHEHEGDYCPGCSRQRYLLKCEMKDQEHNLALVHGIVAPDAPFLCDENCAHVLRGMTPAQCKQLLDTLEHSIAEDRAYVRDHPDADWAREELEEAVAHVRWARRLMGLA